MPDGDLVSSFLTVLSFVFSKLRASRLGPLIDVCSCFAGGKIDLGNLCNVSFVQNFWGTVVWSVFDLAISFGYSGAVALYLQLFSNIMKGARKLGYD